MQNHFELFQLPQEFTLDRSKLDQAYREVQSQVHPDKFVRANDAEKRVAMQWATRANEAYQTLKNPLKRATYLCELHGVDLETESNTSMPAEFLMQQMEWREAFDDARHSKDHESMIKLEKELQKNLKNHIEQAGKSSDVGDFILVAQQIRTCLFLEKFLADISAFDDL
jgi:molecular chaperone HscB